MADASGSPHTATATAMEDTLASVQRALALLHQLQCSVSAFQLPSQLVLLDRLNGLVTELGNMHSASQDCHIQIPLEVLKWHRLLHCDDSTTSGSEDEFLDFYSQLNFIDEGRNPDEFTKHLLNGCVQQNQASKGKVDSFKALRKNLLEQVEEVFPAETEAYRDIRSQSSVESRRATHTGNALSNGDMKLKVEH